MNILIVEDEKSIREVEAAYIKNADFGVFEAEDGESALELLSSERIDLCVLDINLPGIDGIEICKTIRRKSNMPVIMVTARAEEMDELIGLECGADDYVKKPFSPIVLVARIKALLRRQSDNKLEISNLTLDPEKMLVMVNKEHVGMTVTEFNILYALALRPGKIFTRDEIMDKAYHEILSPDVFDRTIDVHIKNIRKKLKAADDKNEFIVTVIGRGYKFNDTLDGIEE